MTDPLIELDTTRLQANPGGQASVRVTVRNLDHRVQGYRLEVLPADVAAWAEVPPPILNLDVDQEGSGVIVFSPPGGGNLPGGTLPFAVKATSVVDPTGSAVAEGQIEVGQVFGLTSKITPVTSSGRWRARYRVTFTNWGNGPVHLRLSATDPDERLGFLIAPESLDLPVGGTAEARVKVRTRHPYLRGNAERLPFKVIGDPYQLAAPAAPAGAGSPPSPNQQVLDGGFTQKPVIGRGVAMATVLALVLVIAGIAFALTRGGGDDAADAGSPPEQPAAPTLDSAMPQSVLLTWTPAEGANITGYVVYLYDATCENAVPGPDVSKPAEANKTSLEYDGLKPKTEYCFKLSAVNEAGESAKSEQLIAATSAAAVSTLAAPTGLTGEPAADSVRLKWDAVVGADHYQVGRYADESSEELLASYDSDGVEFLVPDLEPGSTQCFEVTPVLANGSPGKTPSARECFQLTSGDGTTGGNTTGGDGTPGQQTDEPPAADAYSVIVTTNSQDSADLTALGKQRDSMLAAGLDGAAIWSSDALTEPPPAYAGRYILIAGSGDAATAVSICQEYNANPTLSPTNDLLCGTADSPGPSLFMLGGFREGATPVE